MKSFPLFVLLLLISCMETPRRYKDEIVQKPDLIKLSQPTEKPLDFDLRDFNSKGITHFAPKVKIDTERQEIEITGHSGKSCGIDFSVSQVLRYQLLSNSELEIVMETETLKLTRIHRDELSGIYGDWQSVDFTETTENNRERIVTFFIRDNEIMNVDVYCEQRAGNLFEEF